MYKKNFKYFLIIIFFISFNSESFALNNHIIKSEYIMGTIYKIEVYDNDINKAEKSISLAFQEIRKCDKILSDYRKDSELSKVLEEASSHPVKVSDYFFEITKKSLYFSKITNGLFDITIQPLVDLWGFKNKEFKKPTDKQIKEIKKDIGYQNIILDDDNKTIFFKNSKLKLDFGAIGKGFAIEKAINVLKREGIKSAVVDAVSNQYYLGSPPNSKFWKVGIKSPRENNKIIKYIYVKDKTISTSGDYEQFFIENGIRYNHIIDPITGHPVKKIITSTVISDNSTDADAISTSILLLSKKELKSFIKKFPNTEISLVEN